MAWLTVLESVREPLLRRYERVQHRAVALLCTGVAQQRRHRGLQCPAPSLSFRTLSTRHRPRPVLPQQLACSSPTVSSPLTLWRCGSISALLMPTCATSSGGSGVHGCFPTCLPHPFSDNRSLMHVQ